MIAYQLGISGYDVWIINFRGTIYSLGHIIYPITTNDYWDYNMDHIGMYDLRSAIRFIKMTTKKKLLHIGHSMGGHAGLIYSAVYPEESQEHLAGLINLAPCTYLTNTKTPIRYVAPFSEIIRTVSSHIL